MKFGSCALLVLFLPFAVPASAQMYKCVDSRGVTTYSDKPRPDCKGGTVNIRSDSPSGQKAAEPGDDVRRLETDFQRRRIEKRTAETKEKEERDIELAARREECAALKHDLLTLESASRIVLDVNSKGERTYMDDVSRTKAIAETRQKLRACD
jgi:hypothetical protein